MTYEAIISRIEKAISQFNRRIPFVQRTIYKEIQAEIKRLDLKSGRIKPTVSNLRIVTSIKNKMLRLILTPEYRKDVKDFVAAFREITVMQNEYWRQTEASFTPKTLLKEIRNQAIGDVVKNLTSQGIAVNVADQVSAILRNNITTGGSYAKLNSQLREKILNTTTDGGLLKYTKQITTDAINQYNAQYTQAVSNDLGFEWFAYQGSDIITTRPFCDAMTDLRYFHVSEIPRLLRAEDLYYIKDGKKTKVPIYEKTKLPHGMIPGTNPSNFQINRGGYNCGHQIRPVSESRVPQEIKDRVFATSAYKAWKASE